MILTFEVEGKSLDIHVDEDGRDRLIEILQNLSDHYHLFRLPGASSEITPQRYDQNGVPVEDVTIWMLSADEPTVNEDSLDELHAKLFDIGCIKFGEFTLKSGIISPVYVDFRVLVSHPYVLNMVARKMVEMVRPDGADQLKFDRIAGLPYAALPIATAMSIEGNLPMIYPRKEAKDYGTAKLIEGKYEQGDRVLVIDDVITDGGAKIEAIGPLEAAGLVIKDVAIILDREQGGTKILADKGYKLHSLTTLSQALDSLVKQGKVPEDIQDKVRSFIAEHQFA